MIPFVRATIGRSHRDTPRVLDGVIPAQALALGGRAGSEQVERCLLWVGDCGDPNREPSRGSGEPEDAGLLELRRVLDREPVVCVLLRPQLGEATPVPGDGALGRRDLGELPSRARLPAGLGALHRLEPL